MKLKIISAFMLTFALSLYALTGCQEKPTAPESSQAPSAQSAVSQEPVDDLALYQHYTELVHSINGYVSESIFSYFRGVEEQEKFATKNPDYDCYEIPSSVADALEAANRMASSKTDKSDLDQKFLELYPTMKELVESLNFAAEYTKSAGYRKDKYENGKKLHKKIWNAYGKYQELSESFIELVDSHAEEYNAKVLERMKEDGHEAFYAINVVLNSADDVLFEFYGQEITDENLTDLDLEILQPLYDQYVQDAESCLAVLSDPEQVKKENIDETDLEFFNLGLIQSRDELGAIVKRVEEKNPVEASSSQSVPGTFSQFEKMVNLMRSSYGSMTQE